MLVLIIGIAILIAAAATAVVTAFYIEAVFKGPNDDTVTVRKES